MPDTMTAAVWFTQNVLKERFLKEAKTKKFDINNINRVVAGTARSSPAPPAANVASPVPVSCPHCQRVFTPSSKPVLSLRCSLYKHTTKCGPCPPVSQTAVLATVAVTTASTQGYRVYQGNPSLTTVPTSNSSSSVPSPANQDFIFSPPRLKRLRSVPPPNLQCSSTSQLIVAGSDMSMTSSSVSTVSTPRSEQTTVLSTSSMPSLVHQIQYLS